VYRLAQTGTEEQFRAVAEAVGQMEEAALAEHKQRWAEADERFHSLLSEFGGNPLLSVMMERVQTVIGRLRFLALHLDPLSGRGSTEEHRAVSDALTARHGKLARELHQAHWDRVRDVNTPLLRNGFSGTSAYLFEGSLIRTTGDQAKQNSSPST